MLYDILKLTHILLVVVAVGFNASYAVWLARAAASDNPADRLPFVLRGVKFLDDRFANPAYALLLVTGLAMVFVGSIPLTTFWILAALVLYAVAVVIGIAFFSPTLRRQMAALEGDGPESPAYRAASTRSTVLGITTMVVVLAILFLMVVKPTL